MRTQSSSIAARTGEGWTPLLVLWGSRAMAASPEEGVDAARGEIQQILGLPVMGVTKVRC